MDRLTLISDFNVDLLARFLRVSGVEVAVAPFGQVFQSLGEAGNEGDSTMLWARAESVVPSYVQALSMETVDAARCVAEVDDFSERVLEHASRRKHLFVASWCLPPDHRGYGMLDWRPGLGLSHLLARMNLRLAERLSEVDNIHLLDSERWLRGVVNTAMPKMWYAAKVPYANGVFQRAAAGLEAALHGLSGKSKRLVIVDLDDTIWGGVVGETGWEGIRLGGHDHVGEAFKDFQAELRSLTRRGVQLAIVSKNDESVAMEAIDKHPEMLLTRDDFAAWRINWTDKALNVAELVDELNLGLESVVFLDDNPAERDRVQTAMPDVLVPDWPLDPAKYVSALRALDCFDVAALSIEDRGRRGMYVADRARNEVRKSVGSNDEWMKTLATTVLAEHLVEANHSRVAQLFNKVNQLNLSTRRLSTAEIVAWADPPNRRVISLTVSDRFGDLGLVGVLGVEANRSEGRLVDFILSCRVMGRKVEETMVALAAAELSNLGATRLVARYLKTERNRPILDVLRGAGLVEVEDHLFSHDLHRRLDFPSAVKLVGPDAT